VERAMRASSMKGNPVALTKEELTGIIEEAL
jgi:alcohol dehydrogenase class IV